MPQIQPNSADAYKILGQTYEAQGNLQEAMYAYTKALEIKPEYAEVHAYLGQLYSQKKWFDEAANQYQQAINLGLKWPEVYYNLGNITHQAGYLDAAIKCYKTAIILNQNYIKAYLGLGIVFELQKNYQAAVEIYRKIIKLEPKFIAAYINLGGVLAEWERTKEAIEIYQQALDFQPESAELYNNIGYTLFKENPEQAIAAYHRAIELDPNFTKAHYNLGKALQVIGEHEWAVKSFQEVIKLKPDQKNVLAYSDCAFSLMTIGNLKAAFACLKKVITNSQFIELYCHLLESKLGNIENIIPDELYLKKVAGWNFIKELQKLDIAPEDSQQQYKKIYQYLLKYYIHFGNVLMENESYETAEIIYQRALYIKPDSPEIYWLLGNCLVKKKQLNPAVIVYQIAIQILLSQKRIDETTKIYFHLGKVLEKQQKWQQAIDYYSKVRSEKSTLEPNIFNHNFQLCQQLEGLYLSTKDWILKSDRNNAQRLYTRVRLEKSTTEYTKDSIHPQIQVDLKNRKKDIECQGLNCSKCLWQIHQWFEPKCFAQAVYGINIRSGLSQDVNQLTEKLRTKPILTENSKNSTSGFSQLQKASQTPTFVSIIPEGRAWIMPKKNDWRLCYALAIMTPDNYLLADLSREYPSPLPGCTKYHPKEHQIFGLEQLPLLEKINGKVAVLSVLSGNIYFHWMVDLLPRIEILSQSLDLEEIDWFVVNEHQQPFQQETLKTLGIPQHKILESDRHPHIQAEELVVPSHPSYLGWLQPWGLEFLREVFLKDRMINQPGWPERIYISRGNARYRQIMNEPEVIDVLKQFDFTCMTPESMSLESQIATFAHAKIIVAPHGSGLTNIVFCNPGTKVIELFSPHYIRYYYWQISQLLGLEHYYLIGEAFRCYPIRHLMYESSLVEDIFVNLVSLNQMFKVVGIKN